MSSNRQAVGERLRKGELGGGANLRTQQKAFTRARLLEAARRIFIERGYADVTVEEIAESAGASRATFYSYFRSKTDVVMSLLDDVELRADARYAELGEILTGPEALRDPRLRDWISRGLQSWRKWRKYSLAIWQAATLEPEIERRTLASSERYAATITNMFRQLNARDRNLARERAMLIEIMISRLFYLAVHHDLPLGDEALFDFIGEIWSSYLVSPPQRLAQRE